MNLRQICRTFSVGIATVMGFAFVHHAQSDEPAVPQREPSSTQPAEYSSGDPVVDDLLDRLDAKGKAVSGLSAKIIYRYVTTVPVESEQKKIGTLLFARGEPSAKFLVHFTRMVADGVVSANEEYYAFDGRWYIERNDSGKNVTRREIAAGGEKLDPFELGRGPFPLPFGQKRGDILRHFEVSLAKPQKDDPPHSKHLHCVPRPHSSMSDEYTRVEIFVDTKQDVPIRIVTERRNDKSRVEVDFIEVNLGDTPAGSRFNIATPKGFVETIERAERRPEIDLTPAGGWPGGEKP